MTLKCEYVICVHRLTIGQARPRQTAQTLYGGLANDRLFGVERFGRAGTTRTRAAKFMIVSFHHLLHLSNYNSQTLKEFTQTCQRQLVPILYRTPLL